MGSADRLGRGRSCAREGGGDGCAREVDEEMDTRGIYQELGQSKGRAGRRGTFLARAGSARCGAWKADVQVIRARIYARAEAADAKLLKLSTSFANLLKLEFLVLPNYQ